MYHQIEHLLSSKLLKKAVKFDKIPHDGNNLVVKVTCDNGESVIAKAYLNKSGNSENKRLAREFNGLQFLFEHRVKEIPQPLYADFENKIGIYEFIDGKRVANDELQDRDIENSAKFLGGLHKLRKIPAAGKLEKASDACFSIDDYWNSVHNRFGRIERATRSNPSLAVVKKFLETDFADTYQKVKENFVAVQDRHSANASLDRPFATLSPSDFGFHNALKLKSGEWRYIDFEYFGWDDAAKLIADFFHHPALNLTRQHKERFIHCYSKNTAMAGELSQKTKLIYFVVGLKWCLLMLNVCLPEKMQRRLLAHSDLKDSQVLNEQIDKARKKLGLIQEELSDPLIFLQ